MGVEDDGGDNEEEQEDTSCIGTELCEGPSKDE